MPHPITDIVTIFATLLHRPSDERPTGLCLLFIIGFTFATLMLLAVSQNLRAFIEGFSNYILDVVCKADILVIHLKEQLEEAKKQADEALVPWKQKVLGLEQKVTDLTNKSHQAENESEYWKEQKDIITADHLEGLHEEIAKLQSKTSKLEASQARKLANVNKASAHCGSISIH
ncbi:hypothetical protein BCR34DRAFT_603960 [Clohesyomyces aquaticus]|uniref:Uncharacterized protein n=1 Tax=Clohesyomyces aquaticus TaxID=1231657 RepID=A0A1Y1ZAJ9_9PLEO|nr:hypothetical protein BCR34DRAFT_603960 [Clohesyomyces aquaticus]